MLAGAAVSSSYEDLVEQLSLRALLDLKDPSHDDFIDSVADALNLAAVTLENYPAARSELKESDDWKHTAVEHLTQAVQIFKSWEQYQPGCLIEENLKRIRGD